MSYKFNHSKNRASSSIGRHEIKPLAALEVKIIVSRVISVHTLHK